MTLPLFSTMVEPTQEYMKGMSASIGQETSGTSQNMSGPNLQLGCREMIPRSFFHIECTTLQTTNSSGWTSSMLMIRYEPTTLN